MVVIATYLAFRWLEVPPRADRFIESAILVIVWWQIGRWLSAAVRHFIEVRRNQEARRRGRGGEPQHPALRRRGPGLGRRLHDAADEPRRQDRAAGRGSRHRRHRDRACGAERARRPFRLAFHRARQTVSRGRCAHDWRREGNGRVHRHQEHATAFGDRRADHHLERRPAEEPGAQLQPPVGAAGGPAVADRVRNPPQAHRGAAEDHRGRHPRREERALRACAFRALRRLRAAVRGDLSRGDERLCRLHGRAAIDQPAPAGRVLTPGRHARLSHDALAQHDGARRRA